MTYEEQLKLEELNRQIIENIINTVTAEEFINFYINHNQKETCEYFGLRNNKQLVKILKLFNYDFSTIKPSHFKGKKAARTHESYIEGGKKSAKTQKENWNNLSEEEKAAWSIKQSEAHSTEHFKATIREINSNYQQNLSEEQKQKIKEQKSISNKICWENNKEEILRKAYQTKKNNHSFNISTPENEYYIYLCDLFGAEDIKRQYSDDRYLYACDFYVISKDLFIELNLNWTHGGHPYNPQNTDDIEKLKLWEEKAKVSKFYLKAIQVWTQLDVEKYQTAIKNNLNYIRYYTENEMYTESKLIWQN